MAEEEMLAIIPKAEALLLVSGECVVIPGTDHSDPEGPVSHTLTKVLAAGSKLRWMATWGHGVEHVLACPEVRTKLDLVLTNGKGFGNSVAEFALAGIMYFAKVFAVFSPCFFLLCV